jgi:hypothetical protein
MGYGPVSDNRVYQALTLHRRKEQMSLSIESLSNVAKAVLLARLAHALTISARDTYEAGTDRVLEPEVLRAYNELLHRVCGSVTDHLMDGRGYSVEIILEMMRAFGQKHNRVDAIKWTIENALEKPLSPLFVST